TRAARCPRRSSPRRRSRRCDRRPRASPRLRQHARARTTNRGYRRGPPRTPTPPPARSSPRAPRDPTGRRPRGGHAGARGWPRLADSSNSTYREASHGDRDPQHVVLAQRAGREPAPGLDWSATARHRSTETLGGSFFVASMIVSTVLNTDLLTPLGAYLHLRGEGRASFLLESVEKGRLGRHSLVGCGSRIVTYQEAERANEPVVGYLPY